MLRNSFDINWKVKGDAMETAGIWGLIGVVTLIMILDSLHICGMRYLKQTSNMTLASILHASLNPKPYKPYDPINSKSAKKT